MSGPLNVQPSGLLSLFDLKSGGRYPRELGEAIIPTLDLFDWLTNNAQGGNGQITAQLVDGGGPYAASVAGGTTSGWTATVLADSLPLEGTQITVPSNEVWYVRHYAVQWLWSSVAAGDAEVVPIVQVPQIGSILLPALPFGTSLSSAGNSQVGGYSVSRPFWLGPGMVPRFLWTKGTIPGGTFAVSGTIQLVRLEI